MKDLNEQWYQCEVSEYVHIRSASDEDAQRVLNASERDPNGRSGFRWITLPNGDLVLAVYPQGDLYEELTQKKRV